MKPLVRGLEIAAAIVTIGNALLTLPSLLVAPMVPTMGNDVLTYVARMTTPSRAIVTIALQVSIAYISGTLYGRSSELRNLGGALALWCVTSAVVGWISAFNLEFILIGRPVNGFLEHLGLFALYALSCWIGLFFILDDIRYDDEEGLAGFIHCLVLGLMFVALLFRQ